MAQRALLIGSQTGGLTGVETDVARMAAALAALGFETRLCLGPDASRGGIFEHYGRLISDTQADDAAVVYYSGHGGLALNPDYRPLDPDGIVRPEYYQFIVPSDIDQSTDRDFRGIIDLELSTLLAALTERTKNATVILDCCHSARMSRDEKMVPRALPRPWLLGVAAHVEALRVRGLPVDRLAPESNPNAVRLVACGPSQSAFEYETLSGERMGLFTESLVAALEEVGGLKVSWANLAQRVRVRVVDLEPTQRPDVEGPAERALFKLETIEETGILPVDTLADKPALLGGRLLTVEVGDKYVIVPPGVTSATSSAAVANATVTRVEGARSEVEVDYLSGHSRLPENARAIPVEKALRRYGVRLVGSEAGITALRRAIEASQFVTTSGDGTADPADVLAAVEVSNGQIALRDGRGNPLTHPQSYDEAGVRQTVRNLNTHARAQALRELQSGVGTNRLDVPFTVEWGRVQGGRPDPLPKLGGLLFVGDAVYIRLANPGVEKLYASVYDIGLTGRVSLVTSGEPSGVELAPGADYVVGTERPSGRLVGVPLSWPDSVPRDGQHTETVLVIVSDQPQDLRALGQSGMRGSELKRAPSEPLSQLQLVLDQIASGGSRELGSERNRQADVRYAVEHITFVVNPSRSPARDVAPFLIDERPDISLLYRTPRSGVASPKTVAIRLLDLIVHDNRVLFGSEFKGDVRIDTVVVTAATNQDEQSTYRMRTERFPGIKSGDRLPLEKLLVFHGPATSFLDMGVWVSRDRKDSPSLAELLQTELNTTEFRAAAGTLLGLAVAAPQAAALVGAVGAAATICNIASRLLSAMLGKSIGLYRTSELAQEGFGVGRHPVSGTARAQDFSFAFEILAMD